MITPFTENPLYHLHELHHASMAPWNFFAEASKIWHRHPFSLVSYTGYGRAMSAASELFERITDRYHKPEFGLKHTKIGEKRIEVSEEIVLDKPFCHLLHFKRDVKRNDPKILLVAPMSGHHATLLRGTVEALLPQAEVYITDWIDAKEVPMSEGEFSLDTYVSYVIEFIKHLGPDVHLIAVCQPSVPVLAAVSIMSARGDKGAPKSMTLIGGPIDTREGPTAVNKVAEERSLNWFETHVIARVPFNYPGFMRKVYPGFLQLSGFIGMNFERHMGEHLKFFQHLVVGDGDSATAHKKFYNEYLSTADLPAEFYLQTIDVVFKNHSLPKGEMMFGDERVDPGKIKDTALLAIEGELDDISGVGQTKAAIKICTGLSTKKKKYHLQKGVGHYGLFNGRKYREKILPVIMDFIKEHG